MIVLGNNHNYPRPEGSNKCCVFQPAFGCCVHPKAGQNLLLYIILDKIDTSLVENLTKRFLDITNNTTAP